MTATEKAKRSDALYYETVSVNRRVLCDMIANRESDLEDARAESEHMRLKALAVTGELQEESERLKAENAKLRKLVRELWRTMDLLNACDVSEYDEPLNCIYCEQWGTVGKNIVGCKLKYRMCELGVDA